MKTLICGLSMLSILFLGCMEDPALMPDVDPNLAVAQPQDMTLPSPELRPDQLQADLPENLLSPTIGANLGTSAYDFITDAVSDSDGNIYVTGYTYGALPGFSNQGYSDAFVAKYDYTLDLIWVRQIGSSNYDYGLAIDLNPGETYVYIAGETYGALQGTNAGSSDIFYSKISVNNSSIVTRQFGTSGEDRVRDAKYGKYEGGIFGGYTSTFLIAGETYGAFSGYSNAGGSDAYWAKCTESQSAIWPYSITYSNTAYQFGSSGYDVASSLHFDGSNYVYLGGYTSGSLEGTNAGSYDNFFRKAYYSNGSQSCINQWGTASPEYLKAMTLHSSGTAMMFVATEAYNIGTGFLFLSDCSNSTPRTIDPNAYVNVRDISNLNGTYRVTGEYWGGTFLSLPNSSDMDVFTVDLIAPYTYSYIVTDNERSVEEEDGQNASNDYGIKSFIIFNASYTVLNSYSDVGPDENQGSMDGYLYLW